MQNDMTDDVGQMLMWHDLIEYWCGYHIKKIDLNDP
jgi:hypothetical protein